MNDVDLYLELRTKSMEEIREIIYTKECYIGLSELKAISVNLIRQSIDSDKKSERLGKRIDELKADIQGLRLKLSKLKGDRK